MADEVEQEEAPQEEEQAPEEAGEGGAAAGNPMEGRMAQLESGLNHITSMLGELSGRMSAPRQAGPSEEDRVREELMDPTERAINQLRKEMAGLAGVVKDTHIRTADSHDYNAFHSQAQGDPKSPHAKYGKQVEQMVADARRQGIKVPPREVLLDVLVGKETRKRYSEFKKAAPVVKKASSSAEKPPPGRGDTGGAARSMSKDTNKAMRERLKAQIV